MAVGWIYREGWGLACERDDEAREREEHTGRKGAKNNDKTKRQKSIMAGMRYAAGGGNSSAVCSGWW
jgi:hypothetical protein